MKHDILIPHRAFKACKFAISRDESRYVLNGYNLRGDERGLYLATTDGRRLIAIRVGDHEGEPFSVILKPVLPEAGRNGDVLIQVDLEAQTVKFFTGHEPTYGLIEGKFPDWFVVLSEQIAPAECAFNPCFIEELVKAASIWGKAGGVRVYMHGAETAHVRVVSDDAFIGVLMPIRDPHDVQSSAEFVAKFKRGGKPA